MTGIEAAGEVVGGAIAGRTIEPVPDGEGGEKVPGPGECLNCATPLEGHNFCHHCGQKGEVHRTLGGLFHDFVHGILHFDGKFWRNLPMIVTAPGELTRRYIAGQRARFISPIAVYLFSVVAMFAFVISLGDIDADNVRTTAKPAATVEEQEKVIADLEKTLADLDKEDFPGVGGVKTGIRSELRTARAHLAELKGEEPEVDNSGWKISFGDGATRLFGEEFAKLLDDQTAKAQENPSLYFYKVQTKAYKLSWLLIPLSLPFMFLLFPFSRRFRMYDHAVFVTYSISFMMLLVLFVAAMVNIFGAGGWIGWAVAVPPIHMYRQLRGAYGLGRWNALFRALLLSIMSLIILGLFAGLMLMLGVF